MGLQIRDDRQMKALTGLSQDQFDHLLPSFSAIYQTTQQKTYAEGVASGTCDVLGTQFAMARSKAHENLHKLSPILYDTLVYLDLMPYRELSTPEELKAALQGGDRLLIDATERAYHRAHDEAKQREHDSGKKQQTLKNTVMSLPNKFMVFLGRTLSGHNHGYSMLKQEFPPDVDWLVDINVRVDLGYLGMKSDYCGDQIDLPTKKPRKSQKNPKPQLSDAQKIAHKVLSQVRIFIEHAIGGMKRSTIVVYGFRNRKADFEDDAIGVCAGLWNFVLSC